LSGDKTQAAEIELFDQELVKHAAIHHVSVIAPKLHLDKRATSSFTDIAFQSFQRKYADQFVALGMPGQPKKMQRTEVDPSQAANEKEEKPGRRTSYINTKSTNMCQKES
jgi:hypothetical protein